MRTALLVTLVFAACDNNNLNNNNDDLSMNSNDDLSTMPDQAGGQSCDLLKQDCPTGQKCALVGGGGMMAAMPTCVTAGTVTDGQPCMRGMMGQPDNCAAGLVCPRSGGGGMTSTSVCRKICADDTGCDPGQQCAILSFSVTDVGQCTPTCTPFGTGCTGTQNCSGITLAVGATQTVQNVLFTCRNVGTTMLYGDCQRSSDCPADSYCDPNAMFCTPLCDSTHTCAMHPVPDAGTVYQCQSFGTALASDPGYCG
jgi:hypothetical protein